MTKPAEKAGFMRIKPGDVLLSHTLARAVPSGLRGLTAVFGMGTGVTPSLQSPKIVGQRLLTGLSIDGTHRVIALSASVCKINFMVKPNGLLVLVSSTHYCASTS